MKDENRIKISFTGDLICEWPLIKTLKKHSYNFEEIFTPILKYLQNSDYVVGNLETPVCKKGGYTNEWYSFNTPENFLKALNKANFKMLMTSNNHCLDRGINGLNQTMKNIKKWNMEYVGTTLKNEKKKYKIVELNGIKIAFLGYTYGTNYGYNHYKINEKNREQINLIKEQNSNKEWQCYNQSFFYKNLYKKYIKNIVKELINYPIHFVPIENSIVVDELHTGEWIINSDIVRKCEEEIKEAQKKSDITIFMLHSGGQFNENPGSFTETILKQISATNVPLIVGTHPHVVQKLVHKENQLISYSLGNMITSYRTKYYKKEYMSEYSILLHAYIDKEEKKIDKYSFTILKSKEEKDGYVKVYSLYDLIQNETDKEEKEKLIKDNLKIYNRFLNQNKKEINNQLEYEI